MATMTWSNVALRFPANSCSRDDRDGSTEVPYDTRLLLVGTKGLCSQKEWENQFMFLQYSRLGMVSFGDA